MKSAMKLIMYVGFFCSTNFGMQKELNLYVEHDNGYGVKFYKIIKKDGAYSPVDDSMTNILRLSNRFTKGNLMQSKDWKYHVQGRTDYASYVALEREGNKGDFPLSLNNSDFFVPIELSDAQLKEVVRLYQVGKKNVFVLGQYNSRLDIESISFDIQGILAQLKVDAEKQQETDRLQRQKDEDERRRRDDDARDGCGECCAATWYPITLSLLLVAHYYTKK
jgi:hypothetical protein